MKVLHFYFCSYSILSSTSYFVILVAPHICGMCAFVIFVFVPLRNLSFKEGRSARRGFMRINLGNGTPVPGKDGKNCKTVKIVKTVMAHCTLSFRLLHALGFKFCNKMRLFVMIFEQSLVSDASSLFGGAALSICFYHFQRFPTVLCGIKCNRKKNILTQHHLMIDQGGRCWGNAEPAFPKW